MEKLVTYNLPPLKRPYTISGKLHQNGSLKNTLFTTIPRAINEMQFNLRCFFADLTNERISLLRNQIVFNYSAEGLS